MKIEQIYTGCLAQGAYYVVSEKEALIIDPLREIEPYLARLASDGVQLKYIFETHFHADFVSGHLDLSKQTGAPIVYGPTAQPAFDALIAADNQVFTVGNIQIKVLHTPGHTLESTTYLLINEEGKEEAIFSGDTLFLGDVGRPDLAQKAVDMTQEQLAGMLYDSLMTKIMPLADDVTVYPAHGAGSACGKNMMKETVDTLGNQKKMNYALNQPNKVEFVKAVTDGLLPPPSYFGLNVAMNKTGYQSFDTVLLNGLRPLSVNEFEISADLNNAIILDTREPAIFYKGFIPRSINIGIKGDFAPWVGAIIKDVKQPILLVTQPGLEEETITRLSRVGFDHVLGYLNGSFESWQASNKEIDTVNRITASQFAAEVDLKADTIIDVRKESEYNLDHVNEAFNMPLDQINDWFTKLNSNKTLFIHCAGGYRSMIAASIFKLRGFHQFKEIEGGFKAIAEVSANMSNFISK